MFEAILPSLISAGGSLVGGMMGASGQGATNAQQMAMFQQQMAFNAAEGQRNRDWQKEMSSTAYQRSMADMRAAGLNPILAAGMGGASTPGGAQGSIGGGPQLGNPGEPMGRGVAAAAESAMRVAGIKQQVEQAKQASSQTDLNKATEAATKENEKLTQELNAKAKQDTATSAAQQHQLTVNAANTQADTVNKGIQAMILSHDANTAYQKSRTAMYEADQSRDYGPGTWGNLGGTVEKGIGRAIDFFRSGQGYVDAQQRKEQRLGDFVKQVPEGPGLTIDMRRR